MTRVLGRKTLDKKVEHLCWRIALRNVLHQLSTPLTNTVLFVAEFANEVRNEAGRLKVRHVYPLLDEHAEQSHLELNGLQHHGRIGLEKTKRQPTQNQIQVARHSVTALR